MKKTTAIIFAALMMSAVSVASFAADDTPKKHAAGFITDIEGECWVLNPSGGRSRIKLGMFVYERDTIKTGRRSRVKMVFSNGVEAGIRQNSELSVMEVPPAERGMSSRVKMVFGGVFSRVIKQKTKFNVHTPVVTIAVRGTEFDTDVTQGTGATGIKVFKGVVALENDFGSRELKANMKSSVSAGEPPSPPVELSDDEKAADVPAESTHALRIETAKTDLDEDGIFTVAVTVKDAEGLEAKNFKNKITLNVSDGALLSRSGQNKWVSSIEENPRGGELKFDIKAVSAGSARIVAAAKSAQSSSLDINILRPKERTLRINVKEGSSEREIKIKLKSK